MKIRTIMLIASLSAAGGAFAAEAVRDALLSWTRPSAYVDGTVLPAATPVTYNVYQGTKGSTTKTRVHQGLTTLSSAFTDLPPGESCFNVTAVANGEESAYSAEGCKTFPFPRPAAPTLTVN